VSSALGQILPEAAHSRRVLVAGGHGDSLQAVSSHRCNHDEPSASAAATRPESSGQSVLWWRSVPCSRVPDSQSRPILLQEGSSFLSPLVQSVQFDATASFTLLSRQPSAAILQGQEHLRAVRRGTIDTAHTRRCSSNSSDPGVPKMRKSRPYKAAAAAEVEGQEGNLFVVLLDGKELLSPARDPVRVPSLPLAYAIAAEWEWQVSTLARGHSL